jgi:2-dehydrotetronate isomerase
MPRFAANISTLFTEEPFLERFECARQAGFRAVEFQYAYDYEPAELADRAATAGVSVELMNAPPGEVALGGMGLAALSGQEDAFKATIDEALRYAQALGCERVHVLAGQVGGDRDPHEALETYISNLKWACEHAASSLVSLLIEPINSRDRPRYFLNELADARSVIELVDEDNLRLQLDLYHCQIMEGDLLTHLDEFAGLTEHIQIAGVPTRNEPDAGEINYPYIFAHIDAMAYPGWIGCEYIPANGTSAGLGWFAPYRS